MPDPTVLDYARSQDPSLAGVPDADVLEYLKAQAPDLYATHLQETGLQGTMAAPRGPAMLASHAPTPRGNLEATMGAGPLQAPAIDPSTGRAKTAGPTMQPGDPGSGFYTNVQNEFGPVLGAVLAGSATGGLVPLEMAVAKWGPTVGRLVSTAWQGSIAAGGAAYAAWAGGQDPNAAALGQIQGQMLGETMHAGASQIAEKVGPATRAVAGKLFDWAKTTKGGAYAARAAELPGEIAKTQSLISQLETRTAVSESQNAAAKEALDEYARLPNMGPKGGETPTEVAMAGRAAVENITGYGAPLGRAKVAADGAFERKARDLYKASSSAAQAFERSTDLPFIDGTPMSKIIARMERERPKTLRQGSTEFVLGDKGGSGPPMQSGEIRAEAALRGGQVNIAPGRPYLYGTPKPGLGEELNTMPADWEALKNSAFGQRQINPSELVVAIGNARERILNPDTSDITREAFEKIIPVAQQLLQRKLGSSPVGQAALDTLGIANRFYGDKQEFYKRTFFQLAKKNPENLVEALKPRDPDGATVLHVMAKEAGMPSLPRAVGRQLLDRVVGDGPGLMARLEPWISAPGQGVPSTFGRMGQLDKEFGDTVTRLIPIAKQLKEIEALPGLKGDVLREQLASLQGEKAKSFLGDVGGLAIHSSGKGIGAALLPATARYGPGAAAGTAMYFGSHDPVKAVLASAAVGSVPIIKEGIGYGLTKLALRAAQTPQGSAQLSRGLRQLVEGRPTAPGDIVRLARLLRTADEKRQEPATAPSH